MATKSGTPLTALPDVPPEVVSRLAELWLTTAEEFASAGSQPRGRDSLAEYLGVGLSDIDRLLSAVEAVVPGGVPFAEDAVPVAFGALPVTDIARSQDEPTSFAQLPPEIDLHVRMPAVRNQGG